MPHRPLLIFPQPIDQTRQTLSRGVGRIVKPTAAQQQARLDAKFRAIVNSFQSVQATAQGIEPEQVIVLETIGTSVAGLAAAAAHVEGLEWLAEMDLEDVEPVRRVRGCRRSHQTLVLPALRRHEQPAGDDAVAVSLAGMDQ